MARWTSCTLPSRKQIEQLRSLESVETSPEVVDVVDERFGQAAAAQGPRRYCRELSEHIRRHRQAEGQAVVHFIDTVEGEACVTSESSSW